MNLRNRSSEATGLRDSTCIADIRLVAANAQEVTKCSRFKDIDRIAKCAKTAGETDPNPGFEPNAGKSPTLQECDLAMHAPHGSGTSRLVEGQAEIVDNAYARGLDADVETSPELSSHGNLP
jgi:hypothetical protein